MRLTLLLLMLVFSGPIFSQNYIGYPYHEVLKEIADFERRNPTATVTIDQAPQLIHVTVVGGDRELITYTFQNSVCTHIAMKFSCPECFEQEHRKTILPGKWKQDSEGNYHSVRHRAKVRIVTQQSTEYPIQVLVTHSDLTRREFRKM